MQCKYKRPQLRSDAVPLLLLGQPEKPAKEPRSLPKKRSLECETQGQESVSKRTKKLKNSTSDDKEKEEAALHQIPHTNKETSDTENVPSAKKLMFKRFHKMKNRLKFLFFGAGCRFLWTSSAE